MSVLGDEHSHGQNTKGGRKSGGPEARRGYLQHGYLHCDAQ
ncbi:MAG: hypothetical protein QOF41_1101 [Methylobacteriaceae bacterium]|nr:hypothetical protein [Methylobacteriaceae bacterium]